MLPATHDKDLVVRNLTQHWVLCTISYAQDLPYAFRIALVFVLGFACAFDQLITVGSIYPIMGAPEEIKNVTKNAARVVKSPTASFEKTRTVAPLFRADGVDFDIIGNFPLSCEASREEQVFLLVAY